VRRARLVVGVSCCLGLPIGAQASPPESACTIRDDGGKLDGKANLSAHGQQFAAVAGAFEHLEVTVTKSAAHAHVETKWFELDGDLALNAIGVATRDPALRAGWILVSHAKARVASGSSLEIEVPFSSELTPSSASLTIPCADLTFAKVRRPGLGDADRIGFGPGATPLLKSPKGGVLATIQGRPAVKSGFPVTGYALEHRGKMVRVRFGGANVVEGWVPEAATGKPIDLDDMAIHGGRIAMKPDPAKLFRCSQAIEIFVRVDGNAIQVGRTKAGADVRVTGDASKDEVAIDLGEAAATPFVRRADLAACHDN
jgi:hypothetical protein